MTMEKLKKQGREVLTKRVTLEPVKVLWKQGEVENEQMLLERRSRQVSLVASSPVVMKTTSEQQASVLLDYGTEIHGGIRILVWGEDTGKGAKVRVRFGESASEAMAEIGERTATNDHAKKRSCDRSWHDEHESYRRNRFPLCTPGSFGGDNAGAEGCDSRTGI